MFGKMGGQPLAVTSSAGLNAEIIRAKNVRGNPDVSAQASLGQNQMAVLVWHYHDDDLPGPDAAVDLQLNGIPFLAGQATLTQYRIDADHSNSYAAWLRLGSPFPLSAEQFKELETAGQLAELGPPASLTVNGGRAAIKLNLPRQAVALLVVDWK
jgi:xylan 1,4-beta-xylosidase